MLLLLLLLLPLQQPGVFLLRPCQLVEVAPADDDSRSMSISLAGVS